jgi:hypothetical protein
VRSSLRRLAALVFLGATTLTSLTSMHCAEVYDAPPKPTIVGAIDSVLTDPTQTVVVRFSEPVVPSTLKARIVRLDTDTEGNLLDEDADPATQLDVLVDYPHTFVTVDEDGDPLPEAQLDKTISELSADGLTLSLRPVKTLPTGPRLALVIEAGLSDAKGNTVKNRTRLSFGYRFSCSATTRSANFVEGTYFMLVDVKKPLSVQVQLFAQFAMNDDGTFRAQFTNGDRNKITTGCPETCKTSQVCRLLPTPACVAPSERAGEPTEYPDYFPFPTPPSGFSFPVTGCVEDQGALAAMQASPVDVVVEQPAVTLQAARFTGGFEKGADGVIVGSGSLAAPVVLLNGSPVGSGEGSFKAVYIPPDKVPAGTPAPPSAPLARMSAPPASTSPLRIPLVTGSSAVDYLFGVALFGMVAGVPLFVATRLPGWMVYPLGVLAAGWVFGVLFLPSTVAKSRASDLLLDVRAGTVRVDGGPTHGQTESLRGAIALLAPSAEDISHPDEIASREALARTLRALGGELVAATHEASGEADDVAIARCDGCGAPAPASAEETVACRACGLSVDMPMGLRERVKRAEASHDARAHTEAALDDLLRQPGPRATNALLALAAFPAVIAWPLAGVLFDEFFQIRGVFSWIHAPLLLLAALAFSSGLSLLLRIRVDARRAFALVSLGFFARPPREPGEDAGCGVCGAPLSIAPHKALCRCRYCLTDNVVAVLLPLPRATLSAETADLAVLLAQREQARRRDRWLIALSAALLLLAGAVARRPFTEAWAARRAPILEPSARPRL